MNVFNLYCMCSDSIGTTSNLPRSQASPFYLPIAFVVFHFRRKPITGETLELNIQALGLLFSILFVDRHLSFDHKCSLIIKDKILMTSDLLRNILDWK